MKWKAHVEPVAFWLIAAAHLIPIWGFPFIPTQDGPSHVNNAQIIRDLHNPEAGYDRIFEVKLDPLPNLSSHLLLAGMMYVVPPLIAEKLLVSLYVLGFAGSFRYFLGAFGPATRPLSWAGLLFVFNRCFWMGFYNYCLSLILLWTILGFVLRRAATMHATDAFVLMLLFTVAYFTHLVGFVLALGGAPLAAILTAPRRPVTLGLIVLAALPAVCLTMNYLDDTGFTNSPAAMRVVNDPLNRLGGNVRQVEMEKDLFAIENEVFGYHVGSAVPIGTMLGIYLLTLTMLTVAIPPDRSPGLAPRISPIFPAVFGILVLMAYLFVPDHLGGGRGGLPNGGFLKCRLTLIPPLLWIACLREPRILVVRWILRIGIVAILAINLALVIERFGNDNRVLAQCTAGIEAVGRGHRLIAISAGGTGSPFANPLTHMADYYCLGTNNVHIDNYEALMPHFPVKYRSDAPRGRGAWNSGNKEDVDTVICWQTPAPAGWEEIFSQGPLRICRRR